jgi:type I restriction enzyme M protein
VEKTLVVSRIFDNDDFGFRKITVERPLRLSFQATPERLARLEEEPGFRNLVASNRKAEDARLAEIELGRRRQGEIRALLRAFAAAHAGHTWRDRAAFLAELHAAERAGGPRLTAAERKAVVSALGERDGCAEICRDAHGRPEPDPELRDTESVPLKERVDEFFDREVRPHLPDAWIDHAKTKVGYEIPFTRHFYRYEPPRPLEEIEAEIKALESEIVALLAEVTA